MTAVAEIDVRPEVAWFAEQMEARLRENDHKGGWKGCDVWWLLMRAVEEMGELMNAWLSVHSWADCEHVERSIRECADVAAFCMMAADRMRQRFLGGGG